MKKMHVTLSKSFLLILILIMSMKCFSQNNEIAIGLITDNKTKLSKSFAFEELFEKNPIFLDKTIIKAKIKNFIVNADFGLEGIIYENNVNIIIFKQGKKIDVIKCNNDWETIYNSILLQMQKFGDYKSEKKFHKISEGKQDDFYNKKILPNLPGKLTIMVPENKIINLKSINSNIVKFKTRKPAQELKELIGKYTNADLNDIMIFQAPQVPDNFKTSIKPLLYPISKTMTFSLKSLMYGGVFIENKENDCALNCFFTTLNTSKEILCSSKEKAIIKAFAHRNISNIYSSSNYTADTSKLFGLAADLNTDFSNHDIAQKEFDEYYLSISKVASMCENVENKILIAGNAIFLMALSSVSTSLSSSSNLFGASSFDFASLTNSLSTLGSQATGLQASSAAFFDELATTTNLIKAESYIVDGIDIKNENNYVSSEVLYFLISNPLIVKKTLLEFSADKPKLNKLLLNFYNSTEIKKSKLIEEIYVQFNKIEIITVGLESRNKPVIEKYKSNF